jgi:hypothetical protein
VACTPSCNTTISSLPPVYFVHGPLHYSLAVQHAVIYHLLFCVILAENYYNIKGKTKCYVYRSKLASQTLKNEEFTTQINMLCTHTAIQWFFSPIMCDNSFSLKLTDSKRNHIRHPFPDDLFLQNKVTNSENPCGYDNCDVRLKIKKLSSYLRSVLPHHSSRSRHKQHAYCYQLSAPVCISILLPGSEDAVTSWVHYSAICLQHEGYRCKMASATAEHAE